jgi:hypothetical protein
MIRQKTLKALKTLYFPHETDLSRTVGPRTGFPLSMSKLIKMLSKERESGAVSVLLRLVKAVIVVCHGICVDVQWLRYSKENTSCGTTRNGRFCWRLSLRRRREPRWDRSCFETSWPC